MELVRRLAIGEADGEDRFVGKVPVPGGIRIRRGFATRQHQDRKKDESRLLGASHDSPPESSVINPQWETDSRRSLSRIQHPDGAETTILTVQYGVNRGPATNPGWRGGPRGRWHQTGRDRTQRRSGCRCSRGSGSKDTVRLDRSARKCAVRPRPGTAATTRSRMRRRHACSRLHVEGSAPTARSDCVLPRASRCEPTIDHQRRPGHIGRFVRGQEEDAGGDLLGLGEAAQRRGRAAIRRGTSRSPASQTKARHSQRAHGVLPTVRSPPPSSPPNGTPTGHPAHAPCTRRPSRASMPPRSGLGLHPDRSRRRARPRLRTGGPWPSRFPNRHL
jgi:hypothetical protein